MFYQCFKHTCIALFLFVIITWLYLKSFKDGSLLVFIADSTRIVEKFHLLIRFGARSKLGQHCV